MNGVQCTSHREKERDECLNSVLLCLRLLMDLKDLTSGGGGGVTYQGRCAVNIGSVQPRTPSPNHTDRNIIPHIALGNGKIQY